MGFKFTQTDVLISFLGGIGAAQWCHDYPTMLLAGGVGAIYFYMRKMLNSFYDQHVLHHLPESPTSDLIHQRKRAETYPSPVPNTWYHLCDSEELKSGKILEIKALGQVFALWRDDNGKVVCQDAFCPHLGANVAVGGKIVKVDGESCIQCPFHRWKFGADGTVKDIPYVKDIGSVCNNEHSKMKTYVCTEWCGLVCVYFHAEDKDPEFQLPQFIPQQMEKEGWKPHLKWNVGFHPISVVDMVDQSGDYAHFHTIHSDMLIPWTKVMFPDWFMYLFPLGITHKLRTYRGDDKDWIDMVRETGYGCVDKHLIFFTDEAGVSWNGKPIESTVSQTREQYIGPTLLCFSIPFTIGMSAAAAATFIKVHICSQQKICLQ